MNDNIQQALISTILYIENRVRLETDKMFSYNTPFITKVFKLRCSGDKIYLEYKNLSIVWDLKDNLVECNLKDLTFTYINVMLIECLQSINHSIPFMRVKKNKVNRYSTPESLFLLWEKTKVLLVKQAKYTYFEKCCNRKYINLSQKINHYLQILENNKTIWNYKVHMGREYLDVMNRFYNSKSISNKFDLLKNIVKASNLKVYAKKTHSYLKNEKLPYINKVSENDLLKESMHISNSVLSCLHRGELDNIIIFLFIDE